MANTIGTFTHRMFGHEEPRADELPGSPTVHIALKHWTRSEDGIDITPQLMTESEIDTYIHLLKQDLDHVGEQAKRSLRRGQAAVRSRIISA